MLRVGDSRPENFVLSIKMPLGICAEIFFARFYFAAGQQAGPVLAHGTLLLQAVKQNTV